MSFDPSRAFLRPTALALATILFAGLAADVSAQRRAAAPAAPTACTDF